METTVQDNAVSLIPARVKFEARESKKHPGWVDAVVVVRPGTEQAQEIKMFGPVGGHLHRLKKGQSLFVVEGVDADNNPIYEITYPENTEEDLADRIETQSQLIVDCFSTVASKLEEVGVGNPIHRTDLAQKLGTSIYIHISGK